MHEKIPSFIIIITRETFNLRLIFTCLLIYRLVHFFLLPVHNRKRVVRHLAPWILHVDISLALGFGKFAMSSKKCQQSFWHFPSRCVFISSLSIIWWNGQTPNVDPPMRILANRRIRWIQSTSSGILPLPRYKNPTLLITNHHSRFINIAKIHFTSKTNK